MEAIKSWAKSVFVLSILASTAMLLVPKSMSKQAKFAAEMLILLCVVAPLTGLLSGTSSAPASPDLTLGESTAPFVLGNYLASETSRRAKEIVSLAGVSVDDVLVVPKETGYGIEEITITLASLSDEDEQALRATLSQCLSVPADTIRFIKEAEPESR